uniref:Protein kintoun n=2 Tax=Kryptolebias marmoratus TaxID=37003 RepID=A0A3Q3A1K1_KRYMA
MFCDYAREMSDPENRKKYEEEIKLLEQERGNSVDFIHPTPFRVLETSAGGEQRCFINICGNEKIGKPEFKRAVSEDGRRGQRWSLPLSLSPGRQNTNPKGNRYVIYDVIFHPDTLHMAAKNKTFMDMVDNTAADEIQKAFKVILDKSNMRKIKTKYKGALQPCVIRKPIPGYEAKERPEQPDPLAFPFPDVPQPQTRPPEPPLTANSSFQKAKEPTKPNYTVKYRSVVDLQDFRCSRDSAPSPRPKEIVITVDLPLLKSVGDTSLEVKEKILLLESKQPAYRLELPLAYPVDEDNGKAKFNRQSRQLAITLPVRPPREAFLHADPVAPMGDPQGVVAREEERSEAEGKRGEQAGGKGSGGRGTEEQESKTVEEEENNPRTGEEVDGNGRGQQRRGEELPRHEAHEEMLQEKKEANKEETGHLTEQERQNGDHEKTREDICDGPAAKRDSCFMGDNPDVSAEEETTSVDKRLEAEYRHVTTSDEGIGFTDEDEEAKGTSTSGVLTTKRTQPDARDVSSSAQMFATGVTHSPGGDVSVVSLEQKEKDAGGGHLPAERALRTSELDEKPPAAALREVDADGNETVISDHSTSAGFLFRNKLMYELD